MNLRQWTAAALAVSLPRAPAPAHFRAGWSRDAVIARFEPAATQDGEQVA